MKHFLLTILLIVVLVIGYFSLHDWVVGKWRDRFGSKPSQTVSLPILSTPTPTVAATPTATAAPISSIANLTPSAASPENNLPAAGPTDDLLISGGLMLTTGGGLYYLKLKRDLKKAWRDIDIKS